MSDDRLLLVEDDDDYREALTRALQRQGFAVTAVPGLAGLSGVVGQLLPRFAVVDLALADGDGMDALDIILDQSPLTVALVLTGHGSIPAAVAAMRAGAADFRTKPIGGAELAEALRQAAPAAAAPLDRVEREHILKVLDGVGGNVSEAARRLGLHRRTLQRKLQRMG